MASFRPDSGTIAFRPADTAPTQPSDWPKTGYEKADDIDLTGVSRSFTTARKDGASQPHIGMEEEYINRGGKSKRIPKEGGFFSQQEQKRVKKLRKQLGDDVNR